MAEPSKESCKKKHSKLKCVHNPHIAPWRRLLKLLKAPIGREAADRRLCRAPVGRRQGAEADGETKGKAAPGV